MEIQPLRVVRGILRNATRQFGIREEVVIVWVRMEVGMRYLQAAQDLGDERGGLMVAYHAPVGETCVAIRNAHLAGSFRLAVRRYSMAMPRPPFSPIPS